MKSALLHKTHNSITKEGNKGDCIFTTAEKIWFVFSSCLFLMTKYWAWSSSIQTKRTKLSMLPSCHCDCNVHMYPTDQRRYTYIFLFDVRGKMDRNKTSVKRFKATFAWALSFKTKCSVNYMQWLAHYRTLRQIEFDCRGKAGTQHARNYRVSGLVVVLVDDAVVRKKGEIISSTNLYLDRICTFCL